MPPEANRVSWQTDMVATQGTVMHAETRPAQRIGAITTATGLTPDAVRYYERLGLIPKPARTGGGFRVFPPETVARLRFIKQAQKLGLELKEIRDLLAPANGHRREQCQRVRGVLARHLADVDVRMRELEAFRQTLMAALGQCDRALDMREVVACPVIGRFGSEHA